MGEYFAPVLLKDDWEPVGYWHPHSFGTIITRENGGVEPLYIMGEGAKLMEHSYVGNRVVDAVCNCIRRVPMRVGWLGDYTPKENTPPRMKDIVDVVHGKAVLREWPPFREMPVPAPEHIDEGQWLINLSRKQSIRIPCRDEYGKWTPHPLPLLTSTDGCPTYHPKEESPILDMVGAWKWDLLTVAPTSGGEYFEVIEEHFPNDD